MEMHSLLKVPVIFTSLNCMIVENSAMPLEERLGMLSFLSLLCISIWFKFLSYIHLIQVPSKSFKAAICK